MPDVGLDAVDEYLLRADLRFSPRAARALALLVAAGPGFAAAVLCSVLGLWGVAVLAFG